MDENELFGETIHNIQLCYSSVKLIVQMQNLWLKTDANGSSSESFMVAAQSTAGEAAFYICRK